MIWVLPGFLGQSSDFDVLKGRDYRVIPLFEKNHPLTLTKNKTQWIKNFFCFIQSQNHTENHLMGYSFGGRLAFEVLRQNPTFFNKTIIISANPLSLNADEREQRLLSDKAWAKSFIEQDWQTVLERWNQQAVFKNTKLKIRNKDQYDLSALEVALTEYSLACQSYKASDYNSSSILWLFGEKDIKYVNISKKLQQLHWPGEFQYIPGAGHRLHLDYPEGFLLTLGEFLDKP